MDSKGILEYTATETVPGVNPGPNCVWLRNYGDYAGVPAALARAGIVTLTGIATPLERASRLEAEHATLTERALQVLSQNE